MKEIAIKSGTRKEIIEYLREKIKGTYGLVDILNARSDLNDGDVFEYMEHPVENTIDQMIESGSPIVAVNLPTVNKNITNVFGKGYREQFIVEDYSEVRTNMEMRKLDDIERRDRFMSDLKLIMDMELDASERWNRILKVIEEYKGITIVC